LEERKEDLKDYNKKFINNRAALVDFCIVCEKEGDETTILKRCAKCKVPKYCSTECQVSHWKSGHKAECAKAVAEFKEAQDVLEHRTKKN
jgi:hypothetical protein